VTQRELHAPESEQRPPSRLDHLRAAIVSCLGLGYAPVASGTFGTLGGVGVVLLLDPISSRFGWHFGLAAAIAAAVLTLVGISLGGWAERHYRLKDPGPFVLDEVVGYLVAVIRIGPGSPETKEMITAFIAFRFFDVIKPWPARRLEQLPRGLGIMLDDVVAGLYALLSIVVLRFVFHLGPEKGWS
jgi:phosphatidylglycerophosphatase A